MIQNLESPKELAERIGWPVRRIRNLIANKQIRHHRIGGSILIPTDAIEEFLKNTEIQPCHVAEQAHALSHVPTNPSISFASSIPMDGKKNVQRGQRIAEKLRRSSRSS
ncbi:MAG: excisionase family DNA-binding protein [Rhizobiaceae bacterium]|nr:excisionase family DNA-binding protein [Rhizobiaceae bacterium]